MPTRMNGGVNLNQVLTGSLRHFSIVGADFSGAVDGNNQPVYNSAASIVATEISKKAIIAILDPITNPLGMSVALETNRAGWTAEELQAAIRNLGNDVGIDHLDLTGITVIEGAYDLIGTGTGGGGSTDFLGLSDTPDSYTGQANKFVKVAADETGLIFVTSSTDSGVGSINGETGDVILDAADVGAAPAIHASQHHVGGSDLIFHDQLTGAAGHKTHTQIDADLANLQATKISDAPSDSIIYGRRNAAWVDISSGPLDAAKYDIASNGQILQINKNYFATIPVSISLPNYTSLNSGDCVIVAKAIDVSSITISASAGQTIATAIGNDNSVILDNASNLIFIYNGSVWNLEIPTITNK
jgi:hypothetical protein